MTREPDRLEQDLRRHERERRRAEVEALACRAGRLEEAALQASDPEVLRRILDNPELAGPLARIVSELPSVGAELDALRRERRDPKDTESLRAVATACAQIERQLVLWILGE